MNRALLFAIALAASVAVAALSGCDFGDVIRVKTPRHVQQTAGLPETMSLNESEAEFRLWFDDTQRVGAEWKASIERSNQIKNLLDQISLNVLNEYGPVIAGVPVLGPSLPLITGLAGVLFPRPGEKKRVQAAIAEAEKQAEENVRAVQKAEHDKTWDEAFEAGKRSAIDGFREAKNI